MNGQLVASLVTAAFFAACSASAQTTDEPDGQLAPPREVGQENLFELNLLVGTFDGLRLKVLPYSGQTFNLALEVLDGASTLTQGSLLFGLSHTYGIGTRVELYGSRYERDAFLIAPGADLYRMPAYAATTGLLAEPGRSAVSALSPNVDFSVVHEFRMHFCLLAGLRGGVAMSLNGMHGSQRLAGQLRPDVDAYVGFRL
jgi:hypothetical protein